jgi:hypothetical protein
MTASAFPQTGDEQVCRFCTYRSLCSRGILAGSLEEYEQAGAEAGLDLDFDAIEPVKSF